MTNNGIDKKKLAGILGLAKRAGALAQGTDIAVDAVRSGRACAVFTANDISASSQKKLTDKCTFYKVPIVAVDLTMNEFSAATGLLRLCTAAALTNKSFIPAFEKAGVIFPKEEQTN